VQQQIDRSDLCIDLQIRADILRYFGFDVLHGVCKIDVDFPAAAYVNIPLLPPKM